MSNIKSITYITLGGLIGAAVSLTTTLVFAQTAPSKVRACVTNTLGVTRIVPTTTNCLGTETMYEWDKDAVAAVNANNPPFVCTWRCWLSDQSARFKGKDFSYSFFQQLQFNSTDLSGTDFNHSYMEGELTDSNLSSTDFSSATLWTNFSGATLTSANFSNATVSAAFTNANLSSANLTNANVVGSDFTGATNMNTATLTGVIWADGNGGSTVCPDGTNSVDHSNTCTGHLTP